MTKAEKIYISTYYECMRHISAWGFDESARFNRLCTEDTVCTRTLNAIDKLIDREWKKVEHLERFTLKHPGEDVERDTELLNSYKIRKQALTMTRNTVDGEREKIR